MYSVTFIGGTADDTEYFLNRNAAAWDMDIANLTVAASGAGVNAFTFTVKAITAIPAGAVIPLVAAGQPSTITYSSISGAGVTISGDSLVVGTALAAGDARTITGEFANATPVSGTVTIKIIDSVESNNTTSDTYA